MVIYCPGYINTLSDTIIRIKWFQIIGSEAIIIGNEVIENGRFWRNLSREIE